MPLTVNEMNQRTVQLLQRQGRLTPDRAAVVLQQAAARGQWAGQTAVELQALTDAELATHLARQFDVPLVTLPERPPDPAALACVSRDFCRQYQAVPVALCRGVLQLAVANPLRELPADALPQPRVFSVALSVAPLLAVQSAIERWYHRPPQAPSPAVAPLPLQAPRPRPPVDYAEQLHDLLAAMLEHDGASLHLTPGLRPLMRQHGALFPLPFPELDPATLQGLVTSMLDGRQTAALTVRPILQLIYTVPGVGRFRVELARQGDRLEAVLHTLPVVLPSLQQLGLPPAVAELAGVPHGLVLCTGPEGAGAPLMAAALVDAINATRTARIILLETLAEWPFTAQRSILSRHPVLEAGGHAGALRLALRQDPDVIFIDTLPDRETVALALAAVEAGRLIISTLPTLGAVHTLTHLLEGFPAALYATQCARLSHRLEAIITQVLAPSEDGSPRYAREILLPTPAVRAAIRAGKLHRLPGLLRAGSRYGMCSLDQTLKHPEPDAVVA